MGACRVLLLVALALTAAGSGVAAAQGGADGQPPEGQLRADAIVVDVEVAADGSAHWQIQYKYRLDTRNRTEGFDALHRHVDADDAYEDDVRRDVRETVAVAENQTGRQMAVRNVSVRATRQYIPEDFGVVVHRFDWEGFAATNDSRIVAGDAVRGFWLGTDARLTLRWPDDYEAETVQPAPDERRDAEATWEDPAFGPEEPQVVLRETGGGPAALDVLIPGVALLTVVCAIAVDRLGTGISIRPTPRVGPCPATQIDGGDDGPSAGGPASDPDVDARDGGPPTGAAATQNEATADEPAERDDGQRGGDGAVETPPLSNEEQLRQVLDRNGGRARQQEVADACGWSDSKTSRVVRSLEQEGTVEVFRIGRENVVSYPEVDVTDG